MAIAIILVAALYLVVCTRNLIVLSSDCSDASIKRLKKTKNGDREPCVTYILPGFLPPSSDKFQPYADHLPGDVYLIDYSHAQVFSEEHIAEQIYRHIERHHYREIEFLSISMGSKIPVYLEPFINCSSSIIMNPATRGRMLKWYIRLPLIILLPIVAVLVFLLPFINQLKFIQVDGVEHSLIEILSEVLTLVYDVRPCHFSIRSHEKLILSSWDELVSNRAVKRATSPELLSSSAHYACIDTKHARISGDTQDDYLRALGRLGAFTI